jgi:hypothetical protein
MVVLLVGLVVRLLWIPQEPAYIGSYFASMLGGLAVGWRISRTSAAKLAAILGSLLGLIMWTTIFGLFIRVFVDPSFASGWLPDALGVRLGLLICGLLAFSVLYFIAHGVYSAKRARGNTITTERLPGSVFLRWAEVVFSAKTVSYVIRPLVADTQKEYLDALQEAAQERHKGKDWNQKMLKATLLRLRWPLHLITALSWQTFLSLAVAVIRIARFR